MTTVISSACTQLFMGSGSNSTPTVSIYYLLLDFVVAQLGTHTIWIKFLKKCSILSAVEAMFQNPQNEKFGSCESGTHKTLRLPMSCFRDSTGNQPSSNLTHRRPSAVAIERARWTSPTSYAFPVVADAVDGSLRS